MTKHPKFSQLTANFSEERQAEIAQTTAKLKAEITLYELHQNLKSDPDNLLQIIKDNREKILTLAAQHGAYNIRLFGSVARQQTHANSDIDFLMNIEAGRSLLNRIALKQALEDLLGRKVDIAKPENLHESIREQVLKEAIPL